MSASAVGIHRSILPFLSRRFTLTGKRQPMARTVLERALRVRILTGFSLIIILTLVIAAWSYYHITTLGSAAENLFAANYRSIQYAHSMEQTIGALEKRAVMQPGVLHQQDSVFRAVLSLEYHNITEPGELAIAKRVEQLYADYLRTLATKGEAERAAAATAVVASIQSMLHLNEEAMFTRSEIVKGKANFARISTLGITALLVGIAILLAVAVSRRSLAEFRELDLAKSNFVATAAHELKNPLSSIKTSSAMLLDGVVGKLEGQQVEVVSNIRQESDRLLDLVRELLDLARLETGTLKLHQQRIDLSTLIESAVTPVAMQAEQKQIEIDIAVHEQVPELYIDPNKLSWAITNLLSNAIKYSPRSAVVTVTASRIEHEVWISVTDHGKGIDAAHLPRIFQKFVQVEDGVMGVGAGSGLGLSIAKELTEAHGGRIWATSALGKGSTFTIALPTTVEH